MRHMKPNRLALLLIAGSALTTLPALAQQETTGQTRPPIEQDSGGAPEAPQKSPPASAAPGSEAPAGEEGTGAPAGESDAASPEAPAGEDTAAEPSQPLPEAGEGEATDGTADQTGTGQEAPAEAEQEGAPGDQPADAAGEQDDPAAEPAGEPAQDTDGSEGTEGGESTSGQPAGDIQSETNVEITNEQTVEIRNVIQETDVEPVEVDFEVEVGISVPETIVLEPLPPTIVEIVPAYEGYLFFILADGRIIIVEPSSHDIVYIIVA